MLHCVNMQRPAYMSRPVLQVAQSSQFPEGIRQLAAEFLVCLCEAREKAPGMMRKLPQYINTLFSCMLMFLLDVTVSVLCLLQPQLAGWGAVAMNP